MEIVGYIIGGLNLAIGILITVIRNLDDTLLSAKDKIQQELMSAYKEFSKVSMSETIVENGSDVLGMLENVSNRLMRIHYSSNYDVVKIKRIEWFCDKLLPSLITGLFLVFLSILGGNLFIKKNDPNRNIFLIYFPTIIFLLELMFLFLLLRSEKYLKRLSARYVSREY